MASVLDTWGDFPRIGLIVEGKKRYYPLKEAIPLWDSGFLRVEDSGDVLEADYTVRPMTEEENKDFQSRVDEYSGSK